MNKYGKIPKRILDLELGKDYFKGPYTVKNELDRYPDIILYHKITFKDKQLWSFHAWSKDHVFVLVNDMFNDKIIVAVPRNPPKRKKK